MASKIVVLAGEDDLHADAVLDQCSRLGLDTVRFEPSSLLGKGLRGTMVVERDHESWSLHSGSQSALEQDDLAIFCRDWELPSASSSTHLEQSVIFEEGRSFLNCWAALVPKFKWVDHPTTQAQWDNKLSQTVLAGSLGIKIPKTVATNDPEVVRVFAAGRRIVIKQLSNIAFVGMDGTDECVYTTPIDRERLAFVDEVANCPVLIQERIEKIADLRVTVVGAQLFAALIRSHAESEVVDFRAMPEEHIEPVEIPSALATVIVKMMSRMELKFAALDFGLTSDREYIFFEANVCGNWLWIEHATGLDISGALARLLADTSKRLS